MSVNTGYNIPKYISETPSVPKHMPKTPSLGDFCRRSLGTAIYGLAVSTIFIIGCLAAAGVFTGPSMLTAAVALGALAFTGAVLQGGLRTSTLFMMATAITLLVISCLAMRTSMLNCTQLGYGMFATVIAAGPFVLGSALACDIQARRKTYE